jgi:hypothetical protein
MGIADTYVTDTQALNLIRNEMSGKQWSPNMLDVIAAYVRATGREITEPDDD